MEMTMNINSFAPLAYDEMMVVDGGRGIGSALQATAGGILIGCSPVITVAGSLVAGPVAGALAGAGALGMGFSLVGSATH